MSRPVWLFAIIPMLMASCQPQTPKMAVDIEPLSDQAETTGSSPPVYMPLPDLGLAPELENTVWLNVDAPLRLSDTARKGGSHRYVDPGLYQLPERDPIIEEIQQPISRPGSGGDWQPLSRVRV